MKTYNVYSSKTSIRIGTFRADVPGSVDSGHYSEKEPGLDFLIRGFHNYLDDGVMAMKGIPLPH